MPAQGSGTAGHFRAAHWLWPLLIAAPLLMVFQVADFDRHVSDFFFDAPTARFPYRDHWLLTRVLHDGAKWLAVAFGACVIAVSLAALVSRRLRRYRRMWWTLLCAIVLSASSVASIKHFSSHACPYDLREYGGSHPRLRFFERLPAGFEPGRCWPGGHASTAFSLFGLYFAARAASRPRLARAALLGVGIFGTVLSIAQTARGAHFLSHQIWTALICWYVSAIVFRWLCPRPDPSESG